MQFGNAFLGRDQLGIEWGKNAVPERYASELARVNRIIADETRAHDDAAGATGERAWQAMHSQSREDVVSRSGGSGF